MFRSLLIAAVSATLASAYSIPSCWETCFEKYDIQSEGCLCSAPMESVVTKCISLGCPANNSTSGAGAYESWLSSYCGENTGTTTVTEITTGYTTVCPVTATETGQTDSWTTSTATTVYTTSVVVTPTVWTSVVTSTWSTSTATTSVWTVTTGTETWETTSTTWVPSTWVTTVTPGWNTWTGTNSVPPQTQTGVWTSPVAPYPTTTTPAVWTSTGPIGTGTGTGSWPTTTSPPLYNGAAGLKVGGAVAAVAVAAGLIL